MSKKMDAWFFMRPGFDTFRLEPEMHRQLLFGSTERSQRDYLLGEIEGASFSSDGHKGVVFGDYGLGKTHLCHNLIYELGKSDLKVMPIYVRSSAYKAKEPFQSLFKELVTRVPTDEIGKIATEYQRRVTDGSAVDLNDVVHLEHVAMVMSRGLSAVDYDARRNSLRWLGGEQKVPMGLISNSLKPHLDDSQEFGAVLKGLVHMLRTVDGRTLLYLVDEAERFQDVTHVDTFAQWLASLRELTEITGLGLLLFVGAKSRNNLPTIVLQDEIVRRIGVANYVEFLAPSREQLRDFVLELLGTLIRKGEVPETQRDVTSPEAASAEVPEGLKSLTEGDAARLEAFPFEPDALDAFVEQLAGGDLTAKPSEVLVRLQKAAQRAMRNDLRLIDRSIVEQIGAEGF